MARDRSVWVRTTARRTASGRAGRSCSRSPPPTRVHRSSTVIGAWHEVDDAIGRVIEIVVRERMWERGADRPYVAALFAHSAYSRDSVRSTHGTVTSAESR